MGATTHGWYFGLSHADARRSADLLISAFQLGRWAGHRVGSAPMTFTAQPLGLAAVALMGQARGVYTVGAHLRWSWAIALGYAASVRPDSPRAACSRC